jgi:hypothetical protein
MAPMLFGVIGLAIDYSIFHSQRSQMQEAADLAALAAIREASVNGWDETIAEAAVENFVFSALADGQYTEADYEVGTELDEKEKRIRVRVSQDGHGYFLMGLYLQHPQIEVVSEATLASATHVCVVTLDEKKSSTIELKGQSAITADGCGVFANSVHPKAIEVEVGSKLTADTICSAGGWKGNFLDVSPTPITDCPALRDPLEGRAPPAVGDCDHTDMAIKIAATLKPGVYCGGIKATGASLIVMLPGVYVIKGGEFRVTDNVTLVGEGVGIFVTGDKEPSDQQKAYFNGKGPKIRFENQSIVRLTAPKSGPMAGILVFGDRSSKGSEFEISSRDARTLVGTIYLPHSKLKISGKSNFASTSDWTAIIAREILVENGPEIRLNSDYASSDIPVPEGIAGKTGHAYLTR